MLRILEEDEFDKYIDFAYELATDPAKSGYPSYADGIKTKERFVKRARKAFELDEEDILLFEKDDSVKGWIHYCHLEDDNYAGTYAFCIEEGMEEVIDEFTELVQSQYPACELYLGFSKKNAEAINEFKKLGFECIEESYNDILDFRKYDVRSDNSHVIRICADNYELFSDIHSQHDDSGMYWTSQRIKEALDKWCIFVYLQDDKAIGAIYFMISDDKIVDEIFGIDFLSESYDSEVFKALLTSVLNYEKNRGVEYMIFFNDEETQKDTCECGFKCIDEYVCLKNKGEDVL